jgi:hypothetical protein
MNEILKRYDELLTEVESWNEHKEPGEKASAAACSLRALGLLFLEALRRQFGKQRVVLWKFFR